jgi:hypothetical protein
MVRSRPDLAKMARIRPDPATDLAKMARIRLIWPDPEEFGWNPVILAGSGQTGLSESDNGRSTLPNSGDSCSFTFRNFFVRTKRRKIFLRKLFF